MKRTKLGLALLVFAAPILGQTFGEITGELRDSSGGIVPTKRSNEGRAGGDPQP